MGVFKMFDKQKAKSLTCGIAAIVASKFDSLEVESGHQPTFNSVAFFMSALRFTLWWIVRGGESLLVSFGTSLSTLHGLPPVFDSSDGRYIKPLGALS